MTNPAPANWGKIRATLAWLAAAVTVAAVQACGGSTSDQRASTTSVTVVASDYGFELSAVRLAAGRPIDLLFVNNGNDIHELAYVRVAGDGRLSIPQLASLAMQPGESTSTQLTLDPGKYRFVCLLTGELDGRPVSHLPLGMKRDFEVGG